MFKNNEILIRCEPSCGQTEIMTLNLMNQQLENEMVMEPLQETTIHVTINQHPITFKPSTSWLTHGSDKNGVYCVTNTQFPFHLLLVQNMSFNSIVKSTSSHLDSHLKSGRKLRRIIFISVWPKITILYCSQNQKEEKYNE